MRLLTLLGVTAVLAVLAPTKSGGRHRRSPSPSHLDPQPPTVPPQSRVTAIVQRDEVHDDFYELAEFSPHASLWEFTRHEGAAAPFQATNRIEPDVVFAASSVQLLRDALEDFVPPAVTRPYLLASEHRQRQAEQAMLAELVAAGAR